MASGKNSIWSRLPRTGKWALQMEPLVGIQARIDEQVAMIRRRFQLGPLPMPEAAASSDLSPPLDPGDVVDDLEVTQSPALT
jgi:hypothetical protein